MRGRASRYGFGLAVAALMVLLAGCSGAAPEEEEAPELFQTHLKPIKGIPGHHYVTLSKLGMQRIDLKTTPVAAADSEKSLPYAALLYNPDGTAFVYVKTAARTFRYTRISQPRIVGNRIFYSSGPKAGTPVVTSGVPQVYGADIQLEFGEIA